MEMSLNIPENARLEIKFVSSKTNLNTIKTWITLHPANFISPFPNRQVNNIYFDSYDYAAYEENLSGASGRAKVRYRWYGNSIAPSAGALEVKRKRNYFGWKNSYKVQPPVLSHNNASWHIIRSDIRKQLPNDGKLWFDSYPFPVLINRYYRRYFVTSDQKIRATLDSDQKVFDQRYSSTLNHSKESKSPQTIILEIKFARQNRDLAIQIVKDLPIRISRHSKYMVGVNAITA